MLDETPAHIDASRMPRPSPGAIRLLAALCSPSRQRHELVALAREEPSVVAGLLRAMSSAAVPGGDHTPSVERAFAMLGEDEIRRIASRCALQALQVESLQGYGLHDYAFWQVSVATAYAAEAIADLLGDDPSVLYVAGLLLDLGKIPLSNQVPEEAWADGGEPLATERAVTGMDHAELGAELAKAWGLWEPIPTCIRFHHAPSCADEWLREVSIVHLASWSVQWLGTPLGLDAMRSPLDERALAPLGLDAAQVDQLALAVLDGLNTEP